MSVTPKVIDVPAFCRSSILLALLLAAHIKISQLQHINCEK